MKVGELGEFGLLERLTRTVQERSPAPDQVRFAFPLLLGIGDDTAAWRTTEGAIELCTTDTLVDGVHFLSQAITWREVGWKALAVNYSDIAAMGGTALYSVITLGLPPETNVEDMELLYHGMMDLCAEYGGAIVGGDIVRSPVTFITVALTGVTAGPLLLRSAAAPGDVVAVTGPLGASAGWVRMVTRGVRLDEETAAALRRAHLLPQPRLAEGCLLAAGGVRCAMDISDGLVADLGKVCLASDVAARVQAGRVPVHAALRRAFPSECLALALGGGEDYELVFTAPQAVMERVLVQLPAGAAAIGEIVEGQPGKVFVVDESGRELPQARGGWDHFQP